MPEPDAKKSSSLPLILTILLVLALCCLCIALILLASGAFLSVQQELPAAKTPVVNEQPLPDLIPPNPDPTQTAVWGAQTSSKPQQFLDTLNTLNEAIVPINDPIELAERLAGKSDIPRTFPDTQAPYQVGDTKSFWVTNVDNRENFQITATLRYRGDNTYFWIENTVEYDSNDLVALGEAFDQEIYPTTREFFGSEWSPGVDEDPRIHILYASGLGASLAGYYSSADQLHPDAHIYSNAHEMFLINADNVRLWHAGIYSTLAHEMQHMIHWHIDKNEETWLNEGFSMLAEIINGYDPGDFDRIYLQNPDLQLTDWGANVGQNGPHYGAAMLFTTYVLDRFGEEVTRALVAEQANGLESLDLVLENFDIREPLSGEIITAEDVFADWAVANFLGDPSVGDGRFHYSTYPDASQATPTKSIAACPTDLVEYDIAQFGVEYIEISCAGDYTLVFEGATHANLLPTDPYSGNAFLWSNRGDHSNMSIQRNFDLTETAAPIEMTYHTWYDLEEDYDYVFVSASIDQENWHILNTSSCTTENPSGNSYGCGLNGRSDGWRLETVDLTPYAGEVVTVRFDYVTDAAVNGEGMVIDDIQVEAIGYFTDFEDDDGGWHTDGFVHIQNTLPQYFRVTLIRFGDKVEVIPLDLEETNRAEVDISIGEDIDSIVLVISGATPYTRQRADYRFIID